MHECSAEEMRRLCISLVREGHLAFGSEEYDAISDDEGEALDSETDLGDEDELTDEDGENVDDSNEVAMRPDGKEDEGHLPAEGSAPFTLQILEGACHLVVPQWFRFRPISSEGEQWLKAADEKLESLDRLAHWLTERRTIFLKTADPWDLGCDALEELKNDACSVTEEGFSKLAGIDGNWNRHQRGAVLSWEDGSVPLSFFTSREVKLAWAAQAFVQFYKSLNFKITPDFLGRLAGVTIPKGKTEKSRSRARSIQGISADGLIRKICLYSGITWNEVLTHYRYRLDDSNTSS